MIAKELHGEKYSAQIIENPYYHKLRFQTAEKHFSYKCVIDFNFATINGLGESRC